MEAAAAALAKAREGMINYGSMQGPPYPADVDVPSERYFSGWGVSANAISAPFSTLTAYDLNKGTIKWRVPVGDDPLLAQQGIKDTGARGLRTGIIPTASGLVFLAGGDGKLRAYDEDTGKVLWTAKLPGQSRGIPAIYEVNGKEYLVVNATSPTAARGVVDSSSAAQPKGYIAFALPESVKAVVTK